MGFLGHVIAANGVHPDPEKIKAMTSWKRSTTIKQSRGFLGLTRYYRRFVKKYAQIASAMTNLLRKVFKWCEAAKLSFENLKKAMTSIPVLSYPDFSKQFEVVTDACVNGVGAILVQEMHPIAFYSCKIFDRMIGASGYIKEMFVITQVMSKWRHYLLGQDSLLELNTEV